jgi:DNA-binding winged helix-turn-helix (wHTH) protein
MISRESRSFGPFEFDPPSGRLAKHGHRINLQPKAAAVLSALLERPGELVSRAQLQKTLWPEGTYVDFDLGIKSAVTRLRRALGDDADKPTYIQTIYGEGFRFIAPVAVAEERLELEPPAAPVLAAGEDRRPAGRKLQRAAAAAIVTLSALATLSSERPNIRPHFQNRDWLLIAALRIARARSCSTGA